MTTRQRKKMAGYIQLLQETAAITTDSRWNRSRPLLDKDLRYQAVESDFLREQWFRQYIQQLKRANFIQLLQNTPEITQNSRFHESRRLIDTDPRYYALETDLHRQQTFSQYVEQLTDKGNDDKDIWIRFGVFISIDGQQEFLPVKPVSMVSIPSQIGQPEHFETMSNIDKVSMLSQVEQSKAASNIDEVSMLSQVEQDAHSETVSNIDEFSLLSQVVQVEHSESVSDRGKVPVPPEVEKVAHSETGSNIDKVSSLSQVEQVAQSEFVSNIDEDNQIIFIQLHEEMKEFSNWIKCVLAQTQTREALVEVVEKSFDLLIKRAMDGKDILVFLECMEKQNVFHIKSKRKDGMSSKKDRNKKSIWNCQHASCAIFFKTLVEQYIPPQTDQWEIYPKPKQHENKNRDLTQENQACTSPESEAKSDDTSTLSEDSLWLIAKLYKFTESQDKGNQCQTFQDLDISQVIKLQRCCSLFEFDDSARIYDSIIENRNKLMHSKDNLISFKDLKEIFEMFYTILEEFGKQIDVCARVLKKLKEFEQSALEIKVHDMVQTFQEEAKQALETKEKALKNDISNQDDVSNSEIKSVSDLELLLKETKEKECNLENVVKEMELEIKTLKEINLTANKSSNSVQTDLRYVYLTKYEEQERKEKHKDDEIPTANKKIEHLEQNLRTTEERAHSLENERTYLETQLKSKYMEMVVSKQEINDLEENLKSREEEIKLLRALIEEQERKEKRKDDEIHTADKKISDLETILQIKEGEIEHLRSRQRDLVAAQVENEDRVMRDSIFQRLDLKAEMYKEIRASKQKIDHLEQTLKNSEMRSRSLEHEINDLETNLKSREDEIQFWKQRSVTWE